MDLTALFVMQIMSPPGGKNQCEGFISKWDHLPENALKIKHIE